MGAEHGGRVEENREREGGGQKRKEGGVMNAFCVKAAIVGSRKSSGPPAGLWGGERGRGRENRSAFDFFSCVQAQAHEEGMRCGRGASDVRDGMTDQPKDRRRRRRRRE